MSVDDVQFGDSYVSLLNPISHFCCYYVMMGDASLFLLVY